MAEINDYLNSLNEAMAIHAKNAIKNLQFNKTELCTIVNETRAEQNIYIVWNGSSRYEAYSTTNMKYHIDDRVYVNIPNNDFSQKKYIIGPYVDGDAENLLYVSPFSNFTSSEINLINIAEENEGKGLIEFAYDKEGIKKFVKCELALGNKIELTIPKEEIDQLNKGYKYIAISADFMTNFGNEKVISGDYGIEVHADYSKEIETLKDIVTDKKVYTLTKKDMIGDVYNFKTYFTQKALYELEKDDNPIEGITIILYADDNFKTADLKAVESGKIYIANIEIALGDPSAKNEDVIKIYTNNGNNYDSRAEKLKNQKTIHFKWQDYDDENEITYNYDEENKNKEIKIHWYTDKVHSLGEDTKVLTNDIWKAYCDATKKEDKKNLIQDVISYYQLIENKHYIENDDGEINIIPAGERWIATQVRLGENNSEISDTLAGTGWSLYENSYNKWNIIFDPDITKNNCKVKVIITDENDEIIGESNELEFKNTIQVADPATIAKVAGLKIKFTDGSKGNYPIYSGNTGEILSKSEINKTRKLKLELNDPIDGKSYFTGNEIIIWKIPKNNLSMIYILENFYEGKTLYSDIDELDKLESKIDTSDDIAELLNDFNNYYYIVEENSKKEEPTQQYGINNFYNKLNVNNTIFCYVIKNKVLYSANVSLTFSQYGTSGSEYTFYLGLGDTIINKKEGAPKSVIVMGNPNIKYKVDVKLLNTAGDILDVIINLSWYKGQKPNGLTLDTTDNTIYTTESTDLNDYKKAIIQATTNYGGIKFTQLLPIHVGSSNIAYYDGPDKIIYDDTGKNPTIYSKPLTLYLNNSNNSITSGFTLNTKYQAYIDDKNYLIPANMYYSDNKQPYIITYEKDETKFTCPLLVLQSRYDIPIINEWDGSLKVDGDTNSILAASVIAGTKTNNTFTGLLMGQINKPNSTPSIDTGLFGYQKGTQTFRLGVDGELTLGASGMGQIEFNGTTGTISGGNGGLIIDLKQGTITSNKQFNLIGPTGSEIYFGNNTNYIKIGLDNNGPYIDSNLFKLGKTNTIGGIKISDSGLSGTGFNITSSGLSGIGWGINESGWYATKGYGDTIYVDDTSKELADIKTNLIEYIENRINTGRQNTKKLIITTGADKNPPKIIFVGKAPEAETIEPISSVEQAYYSFSNNFQLYLGAHTGTPLGTIKTYIEWVVSKYIESEYGGTGSEGFPSFFKIRGTGNNEGKQLGDDDWNTSGEIDANGNQILWNAYNPDVKGQGKAWGNCTWSIWEVVYTVIGIKLSTYWGNAVNWYNMAQQWTTNEVKPDTVIIDGKEEIVYYKFDVSQNKNDIRSRSIIVLSSGEEGTFVHPGHVVFVMTVYTKDKDTGIEYSSSEKLNHCYTMEGNYNNDWHVRENGNPFIDRNTKFYGYIYLDKNSIHRAIKRNGEYIEIIQDGNEYKIKE